jgi:hypothetical protein
MPLITNAAAPVDTITITVDNRYSPPDIKFASSRPLHSMWVVKILTFCINGLVDMMFQPENGAQQPAEKLPDLPPAP